MATDVPATAILDARPLGDGALLLDYAAQSEADSSFGVSRVCGPLSVIDPASGKVAWTHPRKGRCAHVAQSLGTSIIVMEETATETDDGIRRSTSITRLDAKTGAVAKRVEVGVVEAFAVLDGDLVTLEAVGAARKIVLRAGDSMGPRWTLELAAGESTRTVDKETRVEIAQLAAGRDAIYAVGTTQVLTIDARTGKRRGTTSVASTLALAPVVHDGALLVTAASSKGAPSVTAIGPDGKKRWEAKDLAVGVATQAAQGAAVLVGNQEVALVGGGDGAIRWRAKLPSRLAGRPLLAGPDGSVVVVPHRDGVTSYDAASGAPGFTVQARPGEPLDRHLDQLMVEPDGLVVWDTWRHVVGFDLRGEVRYALRVRSLPIVHRERRAVAANENTPYFDQKFDSAAIISSTFSPAPPVSGGLTADGRISTQTVGAGNAMAIGTLQMNLAMADFAAARAQANANAMFASIAERHQAQLGVAQRQSAASVSSPYLVRPLVWNVGRGFLVVRKSDGAFAEVVTGPADFYEDDFRDASIGAFDPAAHVLVTFTEGLSASEWKQGEPTMPVHLVDRQLMGFAVDDASFRPAAEYAKSSRVHEGSFLWVDDVKPAGKTLVGQ